MTAVFLVDAEKCLPSTAAWPKLWEEHEAWRKLRNAREVEDARKAAQAEKVRRSCRPCDGARHWRACSDALAESSWSVQCETLCCLVVDIGAAFDATAARLNAGHQ